MSICFGTSQLKNVAPSFVASISCFLLTWCAPLHADGERDGLEDRRRGEALRVTASVETYDQIEAFPRRVQLRGAEAFQRVVVRGRTATGQWVDLTRQAQFTTEPEGVVRLGPVDAESRPALHAGRDGDATVTVAVGDAVTQLAVIVRGSDAAAPPRFVEDVIHNLTRAGCNSGACHGAQHGKGGFKLSLLGYVPEQDYTAVTRDAGARRVVAGAAQRSLLLAKPLQLVPHEGGLVLQPESTAHRSIARWIAAGAPAQPQDAPALEAIEVYPIESVVAPGDEFYLAVSAHYSDGRREDVTGQVLLETLNDGVASVDGDGRVRANASGETSIMVRYAGDAVTTRVTVPFPERADSESRDVFAAFAPRTPLDRAVAKKWALLGLHPSPGASDAEFMRRLYLTAIGTLPSPDEVEAFLADGSAEKRDRLIDRVLERPEYVDYWTLKWGDVLRVKRSTMGEKGMWSFYSWLREQLRDNRPLDALVRDLLVAQGSTFTTGPANYYRVSSQPKELAEITSQVFLGLRLQCAQCHHHPFERWSQDDYYGMAAYFARLGVKSSAEFGVYGTERVVYVKERGELRHPKSGAVVVPKPLDAPPADDAVDRRRALATWLTARDNRLFARNLANRLWGYVMGRGVVEPIDDLRVTNPPTNPELLEALADALIAADFDQKALLRVIFRSRVFQLSSLPTADNQGDEMFFSHYLIRRLPAEVLLDAIAASTEVPEAFGGVPKSTRAIQLPDPTYNSYFLSAFGKPKRAISCECERVSKPNLAQALHLMNGDAIQRRVAAEDGRVARIVKDEQKTDSEGITELYLATFSRPPTSQELERARSAVAAAPTRREGFEDLLWALCNATEFLFNH